MSVPKQEESHKEKAMISVLTNVASLEAQRNLATTQNALAKSIGRLSSGMRINSASDDAAGLGISESLKADISSMSQAQRNSNDGISMSQVAEGGMNQMQGIVSRMRELAVQSANQTLGATERGYIQTEFSQLGQEIDRISNVTDFAGQKLLDGSASAGLTLQVGINNTANDRLTFKITKLATTTLGSTSLHVGSASLSTATNAQKAIGVFDKAIQQLSSARASVGASQNRLNVTVSNLSVAQENLSAAQSRITDVDVASETASLTKAQILSQAGLAVLAQANKMPQSALSLLQG
jgi:flagellin